MAMERVVLYEVLVAVVFRYACIINMGKSESARVHNGMFVLQASQPTRSQKQPILQQ